jgi:hypothetical protein
MSPMNILIAVIGIPETMPIAQKEPYTKPTSDPTDNYQSISQGTIIVDQRQFQAPSDSRNVYEPIESIHPAQQEPYRIQESMHVDQREEYQKPSPDDWNSYQSPSITRNAQQESIRQEPTMPAVVTESTRPDRTPQYVQPTESPQYDSPSRVIPGYTPEVAQRSPSKITTQSPMTYPSESPSKSELS